MNFDVIVGNPPFQIKSKRSIPIWKEFIKLLLILLKDDGYMCLVTPSSWLQDNKIGPTIKKYDIRYINLKRYFTTKIQSSFLFFILKKTKNINQTHIVTKYDEFVLNLSVQKYIPTKYISKTSIDIFNKFFSHQESFPFFIADYKSKHFSKKKSEKFKYPAYHTKAQPLVYVESDYAIKNKKVIFQIVSKFEPFYDNGNIGVGRGSWAIFVNNENEAKNLLAFMNSKLFTFIQKNSRNGGWFGMSSIPKIDISKEWDDEKIYKHFNIETDEEKKIIETYNDDLFYDK